MIDDMALRKLNPRSQQAYISSVLKLMQFLGRSPHTAAEHLRRFQLHLATNGVSSQTISVIITGLRLFFEVTLKDRRILRRMSPPCYTSETTTRPDALDDLDELDAKSSTARSCSA